MATRPHGTTLPLPQACKAPRREVSPSLWFIHWEKGTWGNNEAPQHCGSFCGIPESAFTWWGLWGKSAGLGHWDRDFEGEVGEGLATAALGLRLTKFISAVLK